MANAAIAREDAEEPLFRKNNVAGEEVPMTLTQRMRYEIDSSGAGL